MRYRDYPYLWARLVHPGLDDETKKNTIQHFFTALQPCCYNREFSRKVYDMFGSAEALEASAAFQRILKIWAISYKFTGMAMERLLAQIRRACDDKDAAADAERLASSGFLAQLLTAHRARGGDDPRSASRAQLLEDGLQSAACRRRRPQFQSLEAPS